MNLFSLFATIGIDDTPFKAGIEKNRKTMTTFASEVKERNEAVRKGFAALGTAAGKVYDSYADGMQDTRTTAGKLRDAITEIHSKIDEAKSAFTRYGTAADGAGEETAEAAREMDKASKSAADLKANLSLAWNGLKTIGSIGAKAYGAITGAMTLTVEGTREYRSEMGKLDAAFSAANHSTEAATNAYKALFGVIGETDQSVEAAQQIALLASSEQEVAKWADLAAGVVGKFGDALQPETFFESANETLKLGEATGAFTQMLEGSGFNVEKFNKALAKCNSYEERQALLLEVSNDALGRAGEFYRENNQAIITANEAQDKLSRALAGVGKVLEPVMSAGKFLIADVLEKATPSLEVLGNVVIPSLSNGISVVIGWIDSFITRLTGSGDTFADMGQKIQSVWDTAMNALKDIWNTIGQPVWDVVMGVIGNVSDYFAQKMPAIRDFVGNAFQDIQELWNNNLLPALTAIGDFIETHLVPVFEWAFDNIIAPVVDNAFSHIKELWEDSLKPTFEGILDFITGVFTLDFEKAFEGIVTAVGSIFNGLKSVVKNPINAVIDVVNNFIRGLNQLKIPNWVPAVGGNGINIPTIPKLSEGGILKRGQIGLLEGNGAEAVVPLHNNKKWIAAVAREMVVAQEPERKPVPPVVNITVNVDGAKYRDERELAKTISEIIAADLAEAALAWA